ncbi:cytochrome P450 [Gonapodya prolifera JEL478]|uniref:Cytochrome P450 n=1 Tax=Gonapodya prolifera (strain JEL478) TaxID=1344416 RepID=A0A139AR65_GONPJ|nr:cytochrome P450 [Gonapodya prolifera JEL478]|eukprot:KXS18985.1 cytochrome P450 [Gonapodya prolifera JEL478]
MESLFPDSLVSFITTTPTPIVVLIIAGWMLGLLVFAHPDRGLFTPPADSGPSKVKTAEGVSMWGNVWRLAEEDVHDYILFGTLKYAHPTPAFRLTMPLRQLFILSSKRDVAHVLDDTSSFGKPAWWMAMNNRVLGSGVANVNGDDWRKKRRVWDSSFSSSTFHSHFSSTLSTLLPHLTATFTTILSTPSAEPGVPALTDPHTLDLCPLLTSFILDLVLRTVVGTSPVSSSQERGYPLPPASHHPVVTALADIHREMDGRTLYMNVWRVAEALPWLKACGRGTRVDRKCKDVEQWLETELGSDLEKVYERKAWVREWANAHVSETGNRPSKSEIRDAIFNFIIEAFPPLLSASLWSIWCVGKTPDQAIALHAELDAPKWKNKLPSESNVAKNMVLEALRLFPPIPSIHREAFTPTPTILPQSCVPISAGDYVAHHLYSTARTIGEKGEDEDDLFAFRPGRWESAARKKEDVQSFSCGPRICPCQAMSVRVVTSILVAIFQRHELFLVGEESPSKWGERRELGAAEGVGAAIGRYQAGGKTLLPKGGVDFRVVRWGK